MNRSIQIATRFACSFPLGMLVCAVQPRSGSADKEHGRDLATYDAWLESAWKRIAPFFGKVDRRWFDLAILDAAAWAAATGEHTAEEYAAALHVICRYESGYKAVGPSTVAGIHTATGPGQVTLDTHLGLRLSWPHPWNMVPWYGLCAAAATWREKLRVAGGDVDRAWLGYTGEASTAASRIAAYHAARVGA